mgnify:FL=1
MVRTQSSRRPVTSRRPTISRRQPVAGRRAMTVRRLTASCLILAAAGIAACSTSHNQAGASPSAADASVSAAVTASAANRTPPPLSSEAADAVAALSPEERALRDTALATPEPQRPAEADQRTVDGAVAAAQYFIGLRPYLQATGESTAWQAMSGPDCAYCASAAATATALHSAGGWTDPWDQQIGFFSISADAGGPDRYTVTLDVTSGEYLTHPMGEEPATTAAAQGSLRVRLHWEDQAGWRIDDVAAL